MFSITTVKYAVQSLLSGTEWGGSHLLWGGDGGPPQSSLLFKP